MCLHVVIDDSFPPSSYYHISGGLVEGVLGGWSKVCWGQMR
jgi:hypothetical protein